MCVCFTFTGIFITHSKIPCCQLILELAEILTQIPKHLLWEQSPFILSSAFDEGWNTWNSCRHGRKGNNIFLSVLSLIARVRNVQFYATQIVCSTIFPVTNSVRLYLFHDSHFHMLKYYSICMILIFMHLKSSIWC